MGGELIAALNSIATAILNRNTRNSALYATRATSDQAITSVSTPVAIAGTSQFDQTFVSTGKDCIVDFTIAGSVSANTATVYLLLNGAVATSFSFNKDLAVGYYRGQVKMTGLAPGEYSIGMAATVQQSGVTLTLQGYNNNSVYIQEI